MGWSSTGDQVEANVEYHLFGVVTHSGLWLLRLRGLACACVALLEAVFLGVALFLGMV